MLNPFPFIFVIVARWGQCCTLGGCTLGYNRCISYIRLEGITIEIKVDDDLGEYAETLESRIKSLSCYAFADDINECLSGTETTPNSYLYFGSFQK